MKTHILLSVIWFIFFLLFTGLGIFHSAESRKSLPSIQLKFEGPVAGKIDGVSTGIGAIKKFANDLKKYIQELNKSTQKQNLITALGYFAAALTALFSMFIEIKTSKNSLKSG